MIAGITEGRDLPVGETRINADVCVIGSGCGGATVAHRLAEAGYDVVVLEQGGAYTAADFDQREASALARMVGGRGLQSSVDGGVRLGYANNIGGASVQYWANSFRTPQDRLQLWQERYHLQGHDLPTLTPHFERLERDLNVSPAPDERVNTINALLRDAAAGLGWSAARVPQARKDCLGSGFCYQGCTYDAKQSQLITHIPAAIALGARVYADVHAGSLEWQGTAVRTLYARVLDRGTGQPNGNSLAVQARAYVLAAGGFATPLFLLNQGLKNRLMHLGEHLFCNPSPMVFARFEQDILQWRDIPAAWAVDEHRLARHEAGTRGLDTEFFGQQGRYLGGGYLMMPNQLQPALLAAALPGVGASHRALMASARKIGGTICWIDDAESGRMVAQNGVRKLHIPLTGGNEARIRDALLTQSQLLFAAGAVELIYADAADTRCAKPADIGATVAGLDLSAGRNLFFAPHPGGGARIGETEDHGVIGYDHRVHGVDNLYVADPSACPSPPGVDPSLTIMAFSCVAAAAIATALG